MNPQNIPHLLKEYNGNPGQGSNRDRVDQSFNNWSSESGKGKKNQFHSLSQHSGPISSSVSDSGRNAGRPYSPNSLKNRRKVRKNTREKQRRMELNDKFEKLCSMLNLSRKNKTEKFTILTEAISLISQLKKENEDLKREKHELEIQYRNEVTKLTSCIQQQSANLTPQHLSPPDLSSLTVSGSSKKGKKGSKLFEPRMKVEPGFDGFDASGFPANPLGFPVGFASPPASHDGQGAVFRTDASPHCSLPVSPPTSFPGMKFPFGQMGSNRSTNSNSHLNHALQSRLNSISPAPPFGNSDKDMKVDMEADFDYFPRAMQS